MSNIWLYNSNTFDLIKGINGTNYNQKHKVKSTVLVLVEASACRFAVFNNSAVKCQSVELRDCEAV